MVENSGNSRMFKGAWGARKKVIFMSFKKFSEKVVINPENNTLKMTKISRVKLKVKIVMNIEKLMKNTQSSPTLSPTLSPLVFIGEF
jgi:hypothetical protein